MFVCGDDANARTVVARLVRDIGVEPIDVEPPSRLSATLNLQPGGSYNSLNTRFGTRIGFSLLRDIAGNVPGGAHS